MSDALCFLERAGCEGGGKGILCSIEKTFTLSTVDTMRICMSEAIDIRVEIIRASDSKKAVYLWDGFDGESIYAYWSLGNGSCDCNRELFFNKALGIDSTDVRCSEGRFVVKVFNDDTNELLYEDGSEPITFQLSGDRDNPSVSVSDKAFCLPANPMSDRGQSVLHKTIVRRLTPTECERLQGFPDGWTNILAKTPDSPRYKALGNSMAVPVMKWIGQRIGNQKPVVYDQEAIRNALFVAPIREDEGGQYGLFD